MNVVSLSPLVWALIGFVVFTAGIAIAAGFFGRPKRRQTFPGGPGRYFAALCVQAFGFVLPIPFVWIMLLKVGPPGLNLVAAFATGIIVLAVLRFAPGTGPLLTDLAKAPQPAGRNRTPAP
jgi:hypothetical protein